MSKSSNNWGHLSDTEITYLLRVGHIHVTKTVTVHLRIRIRYKCKPSQYRTLPSTVVYDTRRPTSYVICMQPTYSRWPQIRTGMVMWYRGRRFRDCLVRRTDSRRRSITAIILVPFHCTPSTVLGLRYIKPTITIHHFNWSIETVTILAELS